jgi:L-rhamnonate dehydratase
MAVINDIWIRRLKARGSVPGAETGDFLHISTDGGALGIWGPISFIQSLLIIAIFRDRLLRLTREEAHAELAAAAQERHATGHFVMACTACDLALWDIAGQDAGVPVASLLGETLRTQVPCYASLLGSDLFAPPPADELRALARTYWGLKWAVRVGCAEGRAGIERTIEALARLRDLGLPRLMVDILCAWSADHAEVFLAESAPLELAWVEEPVRSNELAAYRRLAAGSATPLAAGEHAYSRHDVVNLLDCGVAVLQPDGSWCGGLSTLAQMIDDVAAAGRSVFPHGAGLLPALHVAMHQPSQVLPAIEFHLTVEPRRQAFWRNKYVPREGCLAAPTAPGLGVEIDETALAASTEIRTLDAVKP